MFNKYFRIIVLYTIGLLSITWITHPCGMRGPDLAEISLFVPFALILEHLRDIQTFGRKLYAYLITLFLLLVSIMFLIYYATNTRAGYYRFEFLAPRVNSLVKECPVLVICSDENGLIKSCSKPVEVLTGYTAKELYGQDIITLMRPEIAVAHIIKMQEAVGKLRNGEPTGWFLAGKEKLMLKKKNSELIPVEIYSWGVRYSDNIKFDGDIDIFAVIIPEDENLRKKMKQSYFLGVTTNGNK